MPKIADQLERLNTNIEALVAELRKQRELGYQPQPGAPAEMDTRAQE